MPVEICGCCERRVDFTREGETLCRACFMTWYDGDGPINSRDIASIKAEVLRAEAAGTFPFPGGRGVARVQEVTDGQ